MKKSSVIGIIVSVGLVLIIGLIARVAIIGMIAVPNVTDIQNRSQVNADIRTAEQIVRGMRIASMDSMGKDIIQTDPIEYDKILSNMSEYVQSDMKPVSLKDAEYYLVNDEGKIKVAIAKEAADVKLLTDDIMYDGSGAGWAFVEGK